MKKIAIISNIQSNFYALEEFLNYIATKEIDYIYNLGNFFDSDLFCCEIFDKITSDTRFLNIVGRNEQKLLDMAYGLKENHFEELENETERFQKIIERLGTKRIERLKEMPKEQEFVVEQKKLYIGADDVYMDYGCMEKKLAMLVFEKGVCSFENFFSYDYILCGYHGLSEMDFFVEPICKSKEVCFISPGNIYMHGRGKIQFTILEIGEKEDSIQQVNRNIELKNIQHAIKNHSISPCSQLRKYGELDWAEGKSGKLLIQCVKGNPFYSQCKERDSYIKLWKYFISYCEERCKYYYVQNYEKGSKELTFYKEKWTQETKKKLCEEFIKEDGNFAWYEIGCLDENEEEIFSSREYFDTCYLSNLNEIDTKLVLQYLNAFPEHEKLFSYRLYDEDDNCE